MPATIGSGGAHEQLESQAWRGRLEFDHIHAGAGQKPCRFHHCTLSCSARGERAVVDIEADAQSAQIDLRWIPERYELIARRDLKSEPGIINRATDHTDL